MLTPADLQAAEGRSAGFLGRPISDCPARLADEERRAWRAGWRFGRDEREHNQADYEASLRAFWRASDLTAIARCRRRKRTTGPGGRGDGDGPLTGGRP